MKLIHNKSQRMLEVEQQLGEGIEEYMRRRFVDEEMSLYALAQDMGISYRILLKWLNLAGIYSRNLNIKGGDGV